MARFDCATWKPVGNHGGAMARNMGLLLHHAVANGSLYTQFNTPGPDAVSAHFWVSKTGVIEQYVDSNTVAWHAMQMNDTYCGVETEGCVTDPYAEPMTEAMIAALAVLYHEGNIKHGWPYQLANADGQTGFGYHRMGVATDCPCDVRLNKRQEILNRAKGTAPMPEPPTPFYPPFPGTNLVNYTAGHGTSTWQQQMAKRGWYIQVDDQYGPQSESVCRQFQTEKGLDVDGIVGPVTWNAAWTAPVT